MLTRLRKLIYFTIFLCFITSLITTYGQSLSLLENKLQELNQRYFRESAVLDSLKIILDNRAKQIDAEKKKSDYDESNIKKLMSASITISNKIDDQQKKVNSIVNEIEKTKTELEKKYTAVIDSLSELERSGKYKGDKDELKAHILNLTEKKILTAPKIYSLSFNPTKILALDPTTAKTEEEKKIYNEYLKEALEEVNSKLKQVKSLHEEISSMISLQKKTKKFLEEAEFGLNIDRTALSLRGQRTNGAAEAMSPGSNDKTYAENAHNIASQIQTYIYILKQLDFDVRSNDAAKFTFDSSGKKYFHAGIFRTVRRS
ncbi:hypothetical protein ABRY23_11490 [Melioribacteraceae bacterium 4301-Me]|uniref:hypothetical protein n=1 Tax=Pyranulibacter aquaticus TaxID=3163344 RepID=UPI00359AD94B